MTVRTMGGEGFKWFFGVVEDRDDPAKVGRVRVRVHSVHSENKANVPTDKLKWATPINSIVSAGSGEIGLAPVGMAVGTTVFGFFADGNSAQIPIILGTLAGIPENNSSKNDVSQLARGINSINKPLDGPEPPSAYNAKYPYNKVFKSESGHVFEVDDTPNFERTHQYHKSGSYREIDATGRRVEKIVGDDFEIVLKNKTVYIRGNVSIKVDGSYTVESSGNMTFKAPRIDLNP